MEIIEKTSSIISVSRRTDIPAFYGQWFMNRLCEGFAGVVNPFGGQRHVVSLRPDDVTAFVFWSKDFTPFIENLKTLEKMGYRFYFNYTGTCLPQVFEASVDREMAADTLKLLSLMYSPAHINWRFDPIIISSVCGRDFYIGKFRQLAEQFEGCTERCYISFVTEYGKVKRNFAQLREQAGIEIVETSTEFKVELANELADIAAQHGMQTHSCCGPYLVGDKIQKAHCIDGALIERLFYPEGLKYSEKGTRKECGCTESKDIGTYDTCPHGCIYCYANAHKTTARNKFAEHDPNSAFLGYSKAQSDKWLGEIAESSENAGRRLL
jgi:hypothetical protein